MVIFHSCASLSEGRDQNKPEYQSEILIHDVLGIKCLLSVITLITENKNKKKMCDQNALPKIVCVHLVAIQL